MFFFCLGCLVLCTFALFPIFLVLKVESVVDWSWGVVFIPLWIVNAAPLLYSCLMPCFAEVCFSQRIRVILTFCIVKVETVVILASISLRVNISDTAVCSTAIKQFNMGSDIHTHLYSISDLNDKESVQCHSKEIQ